VDNFRKDFLEEGNKERFQKGKRIFVCLQYKGELLSPGKES